MSQVFAFLRSGSGATNVRPDSFQVRLVNQFGAATLPLRAPPFTLPTRSPPVPRWRRSRCDLGSPAQQRARWTIYGRAPATAGQSFHRNVPKPTVNLLSPTPPSLRGRGKVLPQFRGELWARGLFQMAVVLDKISRLVFQEWGSHGVVAAAVRLRRHVGNTARRRSVLSLVSLRSRWFVVPPVTLLLLADLGQLFVRSPASVVAPLGDEVSFTCVLRSVAERIRWKHDGRFLQAGPDKGGNRSGYHFTLVDASQAGNYQVRKAAPLLLSHAPGGVALTASSSFSASPGSASRRWRPSRRAWASWSCRTSLRRGLRSPIECPRATPSRCVATLRAANPGPRCTSSTTTPTFLLPPPQVRRRTLTLGGFRRSRSWRSDRSRVRVAGSAQGEDLPVRHLPLRGHQLHQAAVCALPEGGPPASGQGLRPFAAPLFGAAAHGLRRAGRSVVLPPPTSPSRPHTWMTSSASSSTGGNVTLECAAVGFPPPTTVWEFLGGEMNPARVTEVPGGLLVTGADPGDEGSYRCLLENGDGSLSLLVSLHVHG